MSTNANPLLKYLSPATDDPNQPLQPIQQAQDQQGQLQPINARTAPAQASPLAQFKPNPVRQQTESYYQGRLDKLNAPTPPAHGFWGKTGRILENIGNVAGDIFAPATMALIPGTQLNKTRERGSDVRELSGLQAQDQQDEDQFNKTQQEQQQQPLREAQTREANARADSLENPQDKLENPQQGYSAAITDAITRGVDPATDAHVMAWKAAIDNIAKEPAEKGLSYQTVVGPDGKPHTYGVDTKGNKVSDLGVHYEKPNVTNINGNHEFAENERGRGLLDKAESGYRTAEQGVNGIRAMVDNAKAGDKMSARMLPLEGALEITTSQGVHRINRTEVDQYAGGGNAFDHLAGMLRGATSGVPFTDEILGSMKRLADIQEKGAYENYKGAYDSATKRYHLTDEKPLNAPAGGPPQGASHEVYVNGQLAGHVVNNKYVPLSK